MSALPNSRTTLLEVRLGKRAALAASGLTSAIDKQPVTGPVQVSVTAVQGDEYGAPDLHGGPEQVILHYPRQHYEHWQRQFPHRADRLRTGGFGENFVADRFDETSVCIGDVVAVGHVRLQVSMPRQPCERLNYRFDIDDMMTAVQQARRTGWYYRVLTPGTVQANDAMEIVERPHPDWPLARVQHFLYEDTDNVAAMQALTRLEALAPLMRELFANRLAELAAAAADADTARETWLTLRVNDISVACDGVRSVLLSSPDGTALPTPMPGAHVALRLPTGLQRQYSLCPSGQAHQYRLTVALAGDSRGGSRWLHETLAIGDRLQCSPPRDAFPVAPAGARHVLFAGGIGITPFLSMIEHFQRCDQPYHLYYMGRHRAACAFVDTLQAQCGEDLTLHFTDETQGRRLDIAPIIAALPQDAHVYCCGPTALLDAVCEAAGHHLAAAQLHVETFAPPPKAGNARAYAVHLARRGEWLEVPAGRSLLSALRSHGVRVPSSCETGSCGTCVVRYRDGTIAHGDRCLTDEARRSSMAVCVSHATSEAVVLDL